MAFLSSSSRDRRHGAVAVQVAICLTVLLGVAALAVDGGILMAERRHAQAAADAAALAAAVDLPHRFLAVHRDQGRPATNVGQANYTRHHPT